MERDIVRLRRVIQQKKEKRTFNYQTSMRLKTKKQGALPPVS